MGAASDYAWGAASQATGTALGIATQRIGANYDRRKQMQMQEEMMAMQLRGNKDMLDYTNQQQIALFGPQAYKNRLKEANLNPALMYGTGGAGGQTMASAPSVSGGQAPYIDTTKGLGMQNMQTIAQLKLLEAQKENVDADTENKRSQNPNIPKEGQKLDIEIKDIAQGIKNQQAAKALIDAQARLQNILGNVAEESQDDAIQRIHSEALKAIGEARSAMANGNVDQETQNSKIDILKQEALGKVLENIMTDTQTKNVKQSTEESKARVSKMAQDVAQGWQGLSIKMKEARVEALMKEWDAQFKGHVGQWRIADPRLIARQIDEIMNLRQEDFKPKNK